MSTPSGIPVGWREVDLETFGREGGRVYLRVAGGLTWRFDNELVGVAATASSASDVHSLLPPLLALSGPSPRPFDIVSDVSRVSVDASNASVLAASHDMSVDVAQIFAHRVRRQAGLIARHWSSPFWKTLNEQSGAPWPVEVFYTPPELWAWLGTDARIVAEIEALVSSQLSTPNQALAVRDTLRREPGLGLADVARVLGLSVRSLQRLLAASGQSFVELRNEIRVERALALLAQDMKLEAVANAVGFTSTTHFTTWFRRQRGITPSQFRDPG